MLLSNKVYMFDMQEFFCTRCSVFEEDKETPGWKAGRSVARCEACFREKMENEVNEQEFHQESETNISVSSRSSSSCGGKSLQSTAKNPRDRYVLALQTGPRRLIRGFFFYTFNFVYFIPEY